MTALVIQKRTWGKKDHQQSLAQHNRVHCTIDLIAGSVLHGRLENKQGNAEWREGPWLAAFVTSNQSSAPRGSSDMGTKRQLFVTIRLRAAKNRRGGCGARRKGEALGHPRRPPGPREGCFYILHARLLIRSYFHTCITYIFRFETFT